VPTVLTSLEVQRPLGRQSIETTMIYTHVMNKGGRGGKSPPDQSVSRANDP